MRVLITMMGRSVWGLVNSTWASARNFQYVPDKVHILSSRKNMLDAMIAEQMVKVVLKQFGTEADVSVERIVGGDMKDISTKVKTLIAESKARGDQVAIDVTSGTKDLALGSTLLLTREDADHIFYLLLDSLNNVDHPYMLIPMEIQHPHDILSEVR
jgi:hypothetical protein